MFCKKGVLRIVATFTGKYLCQSLYFNEVVGLRPSSLLKWRLWDFGRFCKIFKNTYPYRTPPVAASGRKTFTLVKQEQILIYQKINLMNLEALVKICGDDSRDHCLFSMHFEQLFISSCLILSTCIWPIFHFFYPENIKNQEIFCFQWV